MPGILNAIKAALQQSLIRLIRAGAVSRRGSALRGFVEKAYFAAFNLNYFEITDNGELWLIRKMAATLHPRYVIDVGANEGEWLRHAAGAMPAAQIVACEPQPLLATKLKSIHADRENVSVRQVALGASPGSLELVCYPGQSSLASSIDWHKDRHSERTTVAVMTGVSLVQAMGWTRVDFIKVDVEGMELAVLEGFKELLRKGSMGVIQFEFGAFALQQHILMRDFCELLGDNYRVGRLMLDRIDFRDYDFRWETSSMSNFVACRRDLVGCLTA